MALVSGFWISRFYPQPSAGETSLPSTGQLTTTDSITDKTQIKVGSLYGDSQKNFKDTATGTIQKGNLNGEGTHYLERQGGVSQRAALTSSVIDLDLFVGRKVEIHGETNTSTKTSWLMDVGWLKVIE